MGSQRKPYLVIWKEGRDLKRIRQISLGNLVQASSLCRRLDEDGKPYMMYKLLDTKGWK